MKPTIIEWDEISDTQEIYDSKPNIFFSVFLYLLLCLLVIALIWMYFGRIEIVVKSEAMLRPNEKISTVVNEYAGTIETVLIEDGDFVNKDDILYTIEHHDLLREKEYLEKQLEDTAQKAKLLKKYKKSVEKERNYFLKQGVEEEYYNRYEIFYLKYEMKKNDNLYSNQELDLKQNMSSIQLIKLKEQLSLNQKLKNSINEGKNYFSNKRNEKEYQTLYEEYKSEYELLVAQYDKKKQEIELSTTKEGAVNSLEYYEAQLDGLSILKRSVENDQNNFTSMDSYYLRYVEYEKKMEQLNISFEEKKADYEINLDLKDYGVTKMEIEQSKNAMEEARQAVESYRNSLLVELSEQITELEKSIQELNLTKNHSFSKKKLLRQNEKDRISALNSCTLQHTIEIDSKIISLKEGIEKLENDLSTMELQEKKTYYFKSDEQEIEIEGALLEYKNTEIQTTITDIQTYEEKEKELEVTIEKRNLSIDRAVVTAAASGMVNASVDLVKGNSLATGEQVLTIIPNESNQYKAEIYVSNADIGKVREGMPLKCNIYALPSGEYGYLAGTVTKISEDIKVNNENLAGYYLLEAKLDNRTLYDYSGEKAKLKVGMRCQAQIVTENKRIITYVLEKLDFWN